MPDWEVGLLTLDVGYQVDIELSADDTRLYIGSSAMDRACILAVMRRRGSCLCGALTYEIEGQFDGVWMCHCSNCRKASGGTGNTIVVVPRERFHWLSGEDHRVTYALRPTYTITRCKTCGTPLPAEEDERNVYLTAGTLDDSLGASIKNHIFYGSRADWERDADGARYFVEGSSGPEVGLDP